MNQIKKDKQRLKALNQLSEYILGTSQQNVSDFLDSGKLNTNTDYLWEEE